MLINSKILKHFVTAFDFKTLTENNTHSEDGVTYSADLVKKDDTITITIKKKEDDSKLKKFVDSLDDELFQEACANVEKLTGRTLKDWADNSSMDENYKMFKDVVSCILKDRKNSISKQLTAINVLYDKLINNEK